MTFFFFQVHSNAIHSFDHRSLYINTINPMRTNGERKHFESPDIASSSSGLQAKVDGGAARYIRPLRTDMRAGRSGCVQRGAEGGEEALPPYKMASRKTNYYQQKVSHRISNNRNHPLYH